ncbi:hypothetical protein WMF45_22665 [Sorangium sp. So ce448]|uniref:hypothetical protein n=1 Tax=Sorangium sp. So ce448 TaxID=3133314 RepID=UPI003F62F523
MNAIIEVTSMFTPSDGGAPRTITIRVGDLREDPDGLWSVAVDVLGFKTDDHVRLKGADWLNTIESAAGFIRQLAGGKVRDYGGTMTPLLLPP